MQLVVHLRVALDHRMWSWAGEGLLKFRSTRQPFLHAFQNEIAFAGPTRFTYSVDSVTFVFGVSQVCLSVAGTTKDKTGHRSLF